MDLDSDEVVVDDPDAVHAANADRTRQSRSCRVNVEYAGDAPRLDRANGESV